MIYTINLLDIDSVEKILQMYEDASFKQGLMSHESKSSEKTLVLDKKNLLQLSEDGYYTKCSDIVKKNILKSEEFYDYVCPKIYLEPLFLKYETGMYYKTHIDSAS